MGLFGNSYRGIYADIPDDQLDPYELHIKKWQSDKPFDVSTGGYYNTACKQQIDGRLMKNLGLTSIDDLFEMKAPLFHRRIRTLAKNVVAIGDYVQGIEESQDKILNHLKKIEEQIQAQQALIEKLVAERDESRGFSR